MYAIRSYYDNDNGFRFLNEAEDLVTQFPNLTKGEAYSLWGYTTDNFYFELNDWLRRGVNASKTQGLKNILTSSLVTVPHYHGTAFRAIKLEGVITSYSIHYTKLYEVIRIVAINTRYSGGMILQSCVKM